MKIPSMRKREILFLAVILLFSAALLLIPSTAPTAAAQDGSLRRVKVKTVDNSGLEKHGYVWYGSQILTVELDGKTFRGGNDLRAQMELDKIFVPGETALAVVNKSTVDPENDVLTVREHWRNGWSYALFGIFCVFLCIFGSWTGVKALFSFVFSCLVIWKMVVPLVLRGWHASWLIFAVVCILTFVIIFLVGGVTKKALAAFAGAISGIFAGLAMAHFFTAVMKINGATMPYIQPLLFGGYGFLDLQDIFIGGIILASSGAVMDLAMDIASGVEEVSRHNPELPAKELILSGLRMGRSVVGTMTTTLLLAYSGGYLCLLMMFASQGTPVTDFLNNPLVASEMVKTLVGSFSLILVAPFTALIAGWIFRGGRK